MASDDHGIKFENLLHDSRILYGRRTPGMRAHIPLEYSVETSSAPYVTSYGPGPLSKLLIWQILRWSATVLFVVVLYAVVKIFSEKGNFDPVQKDIFDVLNIALNLALAYNINVRSIAQ